ncbi:MAG: penicillin-binding protein 2 [Stagnimonas sp.]|nr:penicillin-binding protein 2 [Stagnimonas sp.]
MSTARRPPLPGSPQPVAAWRRQLTLGLLGAGSLLVLARAFHLQVLDRDFLVTEGDKRHIRTVELIGHRGAVLDRNGTPLALSAPVDSLWVVPSELLSERAAPYREALAKLLDRKPREFEKFLRAQGEKKFVYLLKNQNPDVVARLLKIKAPGVFAERGYSRYYPAGEVVGQVVGFCGVEGHGLEGLEKAHDATLEGEKGFRRVIRSRDGRIVEDGGSEKPARAGQDLRLTLDLRLQYLAYRELAAAVERNKASGGMIVIAEVGSGDILAVAAQPAYNPNNPADRKTGLRNRAITDRLEPGSVIKPLMVAQALETGAYTAQSLIDTGNGELTVGPWTVHDIHAEGVVDLAKLLAKSSNVGAAMMGLKMGPDALWAGYQNFGIGEPIQLGFPGEVTGTLRAPRKWRQSDTAAAAYGYGLSMSALHLVRAYAGLANGGLMPQLSLVQREQLPPPRRAVSAASAQQVMAMLRGVVSIDGTASRAAVPGYSVAGKTGTVRKLKASGGYEEHRHWSAFAGMIPAGAPRLVGLVFVDEPTAGQYYGGRVAAPVFSAVMGGAARLLQIPQDEATQPQTVALPPALEPTSTEPRA